MATATDNYNSQFKEINERVKETAGKAMNDVRDGMSKIGTAISDVSNETVREAGKVASDVYDTVRTKGHEQAAALGDQIRRAPLTSLSCAFLGGLVLGALVRRRFWHRGHAPRRLDLSHARPQPDGYRRHTPRCDTRHTRPVPLGAASVLRDVGIGPYRQRACHR